MNFGQNRQSCNLCVIDFFNHLEVFRRPLYHAEEEFYGPGPPSSQFREIRILT